MKILKLLLLCTIILCVKATSFSQQSSKRIEFPTLGNNLEYFTIPIQDKGVLVMAQLGKSEFGLTRFDTNLEKVWSINGTIEGGLDFVTHSYDGKSLYLLFSRYRSNTYQVFKVNIGPGFVEKFQIYSVERMEVSNFQAINNSIFIAGVVNSQPVVLFTNVAERKTRLLPSALKGQAEIQSMEIDTTTNTINVTYAVGTRGKNYQLVVKSFDEAGKMQSQLVMNPDNDFAMMNGKINQITDSTQVIVGTYGHKNTIGSSRGPTSQGMYFTTLIDHEVADTKFHSFTDFKNFFNFLTPRQKEKMEKKIEGKKEKGEDLRLDYRILVHDVIKKGKNYIVVAEAFYPEYRYQNYGPYGSSFGGFNTFGSALYNPYRWGYGAFGLYSPFSSYYSPFGYNRFNNNQQIFDGWTYTHAIVAEFDEKGNLVWDNSIEMKDVKEQKLVEKIKVSIENEIVTMTYSNKGQLTRKIVQGSKVVEDVQQNSIISEQEGDKIRRTSDDNIDFWYEKYFIASGYQKIANDAEGGKRNVFYLSKVSFQ